MPQAKDISVAAKTDITRVALNFDSDMIAVASGTRTACSAGYRGSIGSIDSIAIREISGEDGQMNTGGTEIDSSKSSGSNK